MSEDRILDFLDGRLSGSAEEELLHTLAVSPERRQMLRDHLRLRELTNNLSRQSKFTVPEHVSQQLFTKLTALGFAAPPTTAAILTHAADYVKDKKPAERPRAAYWSGRRMAGSIAMASLVSFLLGVSAFYVFGERLGLRTLSEQRSASIVSLNPGSHAITHRQYASAAVNILTEPSVRQVVTVRRDIVSGDAAPNNSIAAAALDMNPASATIAASVTEQRASSGVAPEPITYTAPLRPDDQLLLPSANVSSHFMLTPTGMQFAGFDPMPFLSERGTISFRFGTGRPLRNTTSQWTSLSELKFSWPLGRVVTARASLGQLMTYEREPLTPQTIGGVNVIAAPPTAKMVPVAGLEMGFTLDDYGIPIEVSAGALADGAVKFYPRASLFGHYDLLPSLSLGVGIEGVLYTHDFSESLSDMQRTFKDLKPVVDPKLGATSETAGFVGLAFELGWHF